MKSIIGLIELIKVYRFDEIKFGRVSNEYTSDISAKLGYVGTIPI